jgi:hypothetical protein
MTFRFLPLTAHRLLLTLSLNRLRIPRRQRYPVGQFPIQADLEGVLARAGQGNIEYQHGTRFDVYHSGRRLAELNRTLPTEQFVATFVDKANPNGMDSDLGPAPAHPEHQMSSRINRREVGQPDMLKHAQDAELALLIDQGVIGNNCEVEVQLS